MSKKEKLEYFTELFNWIDLTGLFLTLIIILITIFELDWVANEKLIVLSAIATGFVLIKIFDWLRLFQGTSFYILLIEYTLRDVSQFLIILFLALLTFGMPLHIMDLSREGQHPALVDNSFGFWPIDIFYNQYLLSLGQFATLESLGDGAEFEKIAYVFFFMATFYT